MSKMPSIGSCQCVECDNQMKPLYECHCCLKLICFKHLQEHVENEKTKFNNLSNMLKNISISLKLNIENKLKIIEKEKQLLERVNHLLDGQFHSIIEMENVLKEIYQFKFEDAIIKVESSLSDQSITNHQNSI